MVLLPKLTGLVMILLLVMMDGVVGGACPPELNDLELKPERVVVKYGDSVSVNCSSSSNFTELSWMGPPEHMQRSDDSNTVALEMDSLTDWNIQLECYMTLGDVQCHRTLPLTIYKTPDRVSISTVGHSGPMIEGEQYELQCDIENVAPVEFLTVKWYKGDTLVGNTTFNDSTKTPVNRSHTLQISPSRDDAGAQYRCEAELDLGPDGPQPAPAVRSDPLNIMVKETPDRVSISTVGHSGPMIEGEQYELQCDIENVASVELLTVKWYKGDTLVESTTFNDSTKTPVNQSHTLQISPSRDDAGAQYRCEAELDLGPDGPQPAPAVKSDPLNIMVKGVCPITLQPSKVVVKYEASASANCSTYTGHLGMGWEASQGPVDMNSDVQLITWKVDSIEEWDIKPFCFINTREEQCNVHLHVTVYKLPDRVSISAVGHDEPMIEGRPYELQCDVQNVAPVEFLTVNWYKGDTLVENITFNDSTKTPVNRSPILQIYPNGGDDGSQYRCEAELNLGPDGPQPYPRVRSDPLNITVYYKPVVSCLDWSPLINTSLSSYPHAVMGNPSPLSHWMQGQSQVESSKPLSKDDSGLYERFAHNLMGNTSCSVNITVEYGPEFDCLTTYDVREHQHFPVNCRVMASPVANVSWFKDGKKVERPTNLTRKDNGLYSITAENKHGTEHHQLTISVLYGPEIDSGDVSEEVYEGMNVTLPCTAKGNPEPNIKWSFNNQTKATGGRHATLVISGVTFADAGLYTCTATNQIGSVTRSVSLVMKELPVRLSIHTMNHTGPMIEDEPYELQCDIEKVSPVEFLTVNWYKGDTLVENTTFPDSTKTPENLTTTLQISPSRDDKGAQYRCVAKLILGPDKFLRVMSDPLNITVQNVCPITLQPSKIVVEYGASASANCSTSISHLGMGWEASQGPVDMKSDVQLITWKVDKIEEWGIKPVCFINTREEQCKVDLQVTIYKLPDSLSISVPGHTGPMIEGGQYKLRCDVYNVAPIEFLTVNWYKGNTLVENKTFTDFNKTLVNRTPRLQISPSRDDDGVQYKCEVKLGLGPNGPQFLPTATSDPLNITVHYKPVIQCSAWSALINTSLNSYPVVMSNPPPTVYWFRRQSQIDPTKPLSKDDSGLYTVVAVNTIGNTSCDLNITVEYGPQFDCPSSYEQKEHTLFSNICKVMASPEADVVWYKDGKKVKPPHNLTKHDNGSYNIMAQNNHGTEHHQLTLNVLYAPEIQTDKDPVEVYEGTDVNLTCTAEGNPEPTIIWTFNSQPKATGGRQTTLKIHGATSADGGVYTCTATNEIGSQIRSISLVVEEHPNYTSLIIWLVLAFILLIIILVVIFFYVKRKRIGKYNVQSNGTEMAPLKKGPSA